MLRESRLGEFGKEGAKGRRSSKCHYMHTFVAKSASQ